MLPSDGNAAAAEIVGSSRIAIVMPRLRRKIKRLAYRARRAPARQRRRG